MFVNAYFVIVAGLTWTSSGSDSDSDSDAEFFAKKRDMFAFNYEHL